MNAKKLFLALVVTTALMTSCNQASQKLKDEADKMVSQTNQEVQKVIDQLGLVYVEEGAQEVITYEEVNVAQQAWCDALVKIGKLKEDGGDYKAFAEQVLSEAYNYDNGKVFFKPTLAYGDQTFRNDKKGALTQGVSANPLSFG